MVLKIYDLVMKYYAIDKGRHAELFCNGEPGDEHMRQYGYEVSRTEFIELVTKDEHTGVSKKDSLNLYVKMILEREYNEENHLIIAHDSSIHNRKLLEKTQTCACVHCLKVFTPGDIVSWCDSDDTALCPYCGIDSVLADGPGCEVTEAFLKKMHDRWFS